MKIIHVADINYVRTVVSVMPTMYNMRCVYNLSVMICRRYKSSQADSDLPTILQDCLRLMRSEQFFLTLSNLTGLSLHPMAASDDEDSDDDDSVSASTHDAKSAACANPGKFLVFINIAKEIWLKLLWWIVLIHITSAAWLQIEMSAFE